MPYNKVIAKKKVPTAINEDFSKVKVYFGAATIERVFISISVIGLIRISLRYVLPEQPESRSASYQTGQT